MFLFHIILQRKQQKIKDANNLISEKQKACTSAVNEINRRLSIDLQRNIDNCNKESLPLEIPELKNISQTHKSACFLNNN